MGETERLSFEAGSTARTSERIASEASFDRLLNSFLLRSTDRISSNGVPSDTRRLVYEHQVMRGVIFVRQAGP